MGLKFQKWQALGNDYIIIERDALPFDLNGERVRRMCAAHFGCHSDGVLLLSRSADPRFVAELRIFNPDGSEAELSGNGAREAILYLRREGWTSDDTFSVSTPAGAVTPTITSPRTCSVVMGRAALASADFPSGPPDGRGSVTVSGRTLEFQHVDIGNPQCVIEAGDELERLDLKAIGRRVETNELFPNRTNASFVRFDGSRVRARIFERGAGETLASGTGASGAAVAAHLRGAADPIRVRMDGGELEVEVSADLDVRLTGTAEPVYAGELAPELADALARL